MLIVQPDFDRRIDLPQVGPCRRPVDIDRSRVALQTLVSLRVYAFERGMVIDGEAEGDEVFVVLQRGAADVTVIADGARAGDFVLRERDGARAVYLPPHASYRLHAVEGCDIAYARAQPARAELPAPAAFAAMGGRLSVPDHATAMTLDLATAAPGNEVAAVGTPERFLHLRSDDGGSALLHGERLGDWDSAVLAAGEPALLTISEGTVDILTISGAQD